MAIELVFETHSTTVGNERGRATGWLPANCPARAGSRPGNSGAAGQRKLTASEWAPP